VSPDAIAVIVLILAGCLIIGVAWELLIRGTQMSDLDREAEHHALMREIRRHDR
jgi:Tfp pilus assembly protein PilO